MKRTALLRKSPLRATKPLRRQSAKKRKEQREWAITKSNRAVTLHLMWCEACKVAPWMDGHHVVKRRFWNLVKRDCRWRLCRLLCRSCHTHLEEHPAEARERGFSMTLSDARAAGYLEEER